MIVGDCTGQQVGEYRLVRLLRRSRFAEVYYGEHVHRKTPAAVKMLDRRYLKEGTKKFLDQACTLAQLEHPHIVRVLDLGLEDNIPFMVMDYAPNGTMRQRYPRHTRLPLPSVVSYARQVASALQYVHDQKLIHRDVKPHNMLLGPDNEIWLSDFGVALVSHNIDGTSRGPGIGDFEGTVIYAAPEQLQGRPQRNSDQYALGVVVYEWLSGEWPFSGSFAEIARQHLFSDPPSLREREVEISPAVEEVVLKALAKEPGRRFGSVEEFAEALEQASQSRWEAISSGSGKRQFMSPLPFATGMM